MTEHRRALTRLVGDPAAFLEKSWGRAPALYSSEDGYADLASRDVFDRLVGSSSLRYPAFRLVREGVTLPARDYTRRSGRAAHRIDDLLDPDKVFALFDDGATIVLEGMHRYWPELGSFCRQLELSIGHRFQVNAYITPRRAQGFARHSDDHDVFVVQVWGRKNWVVFDRNEDPEDVLIEQTLVPGDCLYIPAGFPHAASTGDVESGHLTIGALTHKGLDVAEEIATLALEDESLREGLDADPLADIDLTITNQLQSLRDRLDSLDHSELKRRVTRRLIRSNQDLMRGQLQRLEDAAEITDDTVARIRDGIRWAIITTEDVAHLILPDRELTMPGSLEGSLRMILDGQHRRIGDLAEELDEPSRLILVRRLIREGVVEIAE